MNVRSTLTLTLALACLGCAATTPTVPDLDVTATAVVVHPGTAAPIHTGHLSPEEWPAASESTHQRQILVDAKVQRADESVQCPKILMLEGQPATIFVGNVDDEGNEDGLHIEVVIDGDTAKLDARELLRGKLVARRELRVPVTPLAE